MAEQTLLDREMAEKVKRQQEKAREIVRQSPAGLDAATKRRLEEEKRKLQQQQGE